MTEQMRMLVWPTEGPPCICDPSRVDNRVCGDHFRQGLGDGRARATFEDIATCEACQRIRAKEYHTHVNCPQDYAHGLLCHDHFQRGRGSRPTKKWEQDLCLMCQQARRVAYEREQQHDTIVHTAPYGEHIPLTCRNHPELRWHTKNIDYVGARSIFYSTGSLLKYGIECDCPFSDLIVVRDAICA